MAGSTKPFSNLVAAASLGLAAATLGVLSPVLAQDQVRTEQIRFAAGTSGTTINDSITGYENVLYRVGAEAGQRMKIQLEPSNAATYFNVYVPGQGPGEEALVNSQFMGPTVPDLNIFDGVLPISGEYTVSVYMMRSAARRNEVSNYNMAISVEGETGDRVQADYADSLQGGPDFYQVVTSGGTLNLRSDPSAGASVIARLNNGQNVRNLGCRMKDSRRWCRVATLADPGFEGWTAGDFLVEGSNDPSAGADSNSASSGAGAGASGGEGSTMIVRFPAGSTGTELTDSLQPQASRRYVIGASNGQFLYFRLAANGPGMTYVIYNPDGSVLLDEMAAAKEYRGQLWQSGDHVVEVYNTANDAQSYNIIFGIE